MYASYLKAYLDRGLKLNIGYFFEVFNSFYAKIHSKILKRAADDNLNFIEWNKALQALKDNLDKEFELLIEGGKNFVGNKTFIEETRQELLQLKPMVINEMLLPKLSKEYNIEGLISDIKEEVKKGNRVSFKLIQELQSYIEEFSNTLPEKEIIKGELKKYEKKISDFTMLAIKSIDSMDLIYQSLITTQLTEWAHQVNNIIINFIKELDNVGIEEIPTYGLFFDGEIMKSIGTVQKSNANNLQKYEVYSVKERAFRIKETQEVIRKATVITIN